MKQFRITKYNPVNRNDKGYYMLDEWTDFSDIGEMFNGIELTMANYLKYEKAYIITAVSIMKRCNINFLTVKNLEKRFRRQKIKESQEIPIEYVKIVLKDILRNKVWCRLESENAFIHIGFDFYMYLGCNLSKQEAQNIATENGLFCEEFLSPYYEKINNSLENQD